MRRKFTILLTTAGLALGMVSIAANSGRAAPPSGPTVVSGISINTGAEGEAVVDVRMTRPTAYKVFRLDSPARLVVDLQEAFYRGRQRNYPAESPLLKGVRIGQFRASSPAVVRVVADLTADPAFEVHAQPGGVRLELKSRQLAKAPDNSGIADVPTPLGDKALLNLAQVEFTVSSPVAPAETEGAKTPEASQVNIPHAAASEPTTLPAVKAVSSVDYQAVLPAPPGSKEVTATPRPEPPAQTPESLKAASAATILSGSTEALAISGALQGQTPAPAVTATPAPSGQEKPKYTGEPISLNLKDVDLKDFFRLIHEISGLNIIIDPNVSGSVTLVLDSVPWDQALDIVLKNNGLDKTLEGNVLRIARVQTIQAEQEAAKKLAEAREEAQPLVTVFRPVNYAKASTIATMLKAWTGGGALSRRGNILVDDRTNTLIVSDIQTQIPIIESIINKLDKKAKQISIEARIVLVNSTYARTLTSAIAAATHNASGSTQVLGATGSPTLAASATTPPVITSPSPFTNGGFGVFAISNASARYAIDAVLAATESKLLSKTISRPSIVTQNNVVGTVTQGTQIPIQTVINNTPTVQLVSAALTLTVTPQVTEDGNVFLAIVVSNNQPTTASFANGNPGISTQQATTQVLVPDGGTVVFGGVTASQRSKSATYVPLIGSIPVIGHLFKTSTASDSDNELLFFVSPKVLPG